jgi:hypothetical protein
MSTTLEITEFRADLTCTLPGTFLECLDFVKKRNLNLNYKSARDKGDS